MTGEAGRVAVAGVQIGARLGDVEGNVERLLDGVRKAVAAGAHLAVLPETITSGYLFESWDEAAAAARPIDGDEVGSVATAAAELGVHVVFGLLERDGKHIYNTAVLVGPSGLLGRYRKRHLPFLGLDRFVDKGDDQEAAVFATPLGRVGLAICYDIRFPESARCLALRGADVIAQPSVWPASVDIIANHMVRVRAAENHVFLVAVTRGDVEAGVQYRGNSQIVDPRGEILAWAEQGDAIITAEVDLRFAAQKKIVVRPGEYEVSLFEDRRPHAYRAITQSS